jgi:hypothetical protein
MAHYFCMANYETQDAFLMGDDINSVEQVAMPIEVSEDGNMFTIKSTTINVYDVDENNKPIVDDKGEIITKKVQLYPNIIYESMTGYAFYNNHIISDVVLTRGWDDGAAPAPAPAKASVNSVYSKKVEVKNISAPSTFKQGYNATAFVPKAKKAEVKVKVESEFTADYRVIVCVVEDRITGYQFGVQGYPDGQDDYLHRHVARKLVTSYGISGEKLGDNAMIPAGEEAEASWTFDVDPAWNLQNTEIYALAIDSNGYVNNMNVCQIDGGDSGYDTK